jgi:hypothetical protein
MATSFVIAIAVAAQNGANFHAKKLSTLRIVEPKLAKVINLVNLKMRNLL